MSKSNTFVIFGQGSKHSPIPFVDIPFSRQMAERMKYLFVAFHLRENGDSNCTSYLSEHTKLNFIKINFINYFKINFIRPVRKCTKYSPCWFSFEEYLVVIVKVPPISCNTAIDY